MHRETAGEVADELLVDGRGERDVARGKLSAVADMIETQVRLWAQQAVLAYLDEQPAAAQNLITQIASATGLPTRWKVAVDEAVALSRGWIQIAVGFHGSEMWTPEQQSVGHRAVVEKLVPESLRHQVLGQVDVLDAHEEAVAAAHAAGEAVPEHPWLSTKTLGEPVLHAVATLIVWLAEQPQVHEGAPSRVRDELLDDIELTTAELGGAPRAGKAQPAPDQDALDLLLDLHDGEDIAQVPADPAERTPLHNALVEIAARHLREHHGAAPTPTQAEQLRREIMLALGGTVDHEDALDAIPADAPALEAADRDAVEAAAVRLLHGVLTHSAPAVRDAAAAVAAYGPRAQRLARSVIEDLGQVWFTRLRRTTTVRTSTLLPGMQSIIERVVPHEHRDRTSNAHLPALMKIGPEGPADLHPYPTRDIEADLYLMAVYCGWMGMQPQNNPQRTRTELGKVVSYLGRDDRTRSTLNLSIRERAQARETLREVIGPAAERVLEPETPGDEPDRLLAAAFDARHDADAVAQVRRIADGLQECAAARRDEEARARGRTLSPEEKAARLEAERQRRAKRKKKRKN